MRHHLPVSRSGASSSRASLGLAVGMLVVGMVAASGCSGTSPAADISASPSTTPFVPSVSPSSSPSTAPTVSVDQALADAKDVCLNYRTYFAPIVQGALRPARKAAELFNLGQGEQAAGGPLVSNAPIILIGASGNLAALGDPQWIPLKSAEERLVNGLPASRSENPAAVVARAAAAGRALELLCKPLAT